MSHDVTSHAERTAAVYTLIADLPRSDYQTPRRALPPNGIYLFFERGENGVINGQMVERIVRVGTHRQNARYPGRLYHHYGSARTLGGNKNASVFRRHVGGALLQREHPDDARLAAWSQQHGASAPEVEAAVSQYFRDHFTYLTLPVNDPAERLALEAGLIALLAQYPLLQPSAAWLGHHATHAAVRRSGLWNTQKVDDAPLTNAQLERIAALLAGTAAASPPSTTADAPRQRLQRAPHGESAASAQTLAHTTERRQPRSRDDVPTLVIIPCGSAKVWDRWPNAGPTPARDAYTGGPFVVNRQYAQRMGTRWVILSAKYGFLDPDDLIEDYNVTFKLRKTNPIAFDVLQQQVRERGLDQFPQVIALGGKEYQAAVRAAFSDCPVDIVSPFAGLPIGKMLQATKQALDAADARSSSPHAAPPN